MIHGQKLTRWFQRLVGGELRSPQAIIQAQREEIAGPADLDRRFLVTPHHGATFDAPERLRAPAHMLTDSFLSQHDRADWQHTDRRLMIWASKFIEEARQREIPLYVHSALRTEKEQHAVFHAGNSKTPYPRSAHNIGEAVDIVHGTLHWNMTREEWAYLHTLGRLCLDRLNAQLPKDQKLHLVWGGDFKSLYDPAHWEIQDYRARIRRLPLGLPVRYTPRAILARFKL